MNFMQPLSGKGVVEFCFSLAVIILLTTTPPVLSATLRGFQSSSSILRQKSLSSRSGVQPSTSVTSSALKTRVSEYLKKYGWLSATTFGEESTSIDVKIDGHQMTFLVRKNSDELCLSDPYKITDTYTKINCGKALDEIFSQSQQIRESMKVSSKSSSSSSSMSTGEQRNRQRYWDVQTIINAIYQYTLDHKSKLPESIQGLLVNQSKEICQTDSKDCQGMVDLKVLANAYLVKIPIDPGIRSSEKGTRYFITKTPDGRITISAANAELGQIIEINR